MACFAFVIIFVVIALLFHGQAAGWGPRSVTRAFQALPRRFGGVCHGGRFLQSPSVRFQYGPTWVTISIRKGRATAPTTRAHLKWPDRCTDLVVTTRDPMEADVGTVSSLVTIGDQQFQQQYVVNGSPARDVKSLLSDGVRWQIEKLAQSFDCRYLSFSIQGGQMQIDKPTLFRRREDLELFTQLCLELFDQAMLTRSEGIEFLEGSTEAQIIENPICQICGESIESEMIVCQRCRTPHHLDCWQYTGRCSTFGCQESRYEVPRVAQPVLPPDEDVSPEPDEP